MNDIPVGTIVGIRKDSEFYGNNPYSNPAEVPGEVIECNLGRGLNYQVRWLHSGRVNIYARKDLRYWRGAYEHFRGRVVAVPKPGAAAPKPPKANSREEAIEQAKAAILKSERDVTARYAFVYTDFSYRVSQNTACHHSVLSLDREEAKEVSAIVTCINRGTKRDIESCPLDASLWFYNWLLNDSPWADAFEEKDAEAAYKAGVLVCTTNVPGNILQAALVASRQVWEHPRVIRVAYRMSKEGLGGNLCFLLGSFLTDSGKQSLLHSPHGGGHFPLGCYDMTDSSCLRFVKNKPENVEGIYCQGGSSWGVHKLFSGDTGKEKTFSATVREWIDKAGQKGSGGTNPFAKAKTQEEKVVRPEDLASIIKEEGKFA